MADRADFAAAVRALAAEELRRAGDHPEAEEIAAYAAGTLAPERAEALGRHLAVCAECADLVLEYREFTPVPGGGSAAGGEAAAVYDAVRRRLGLPPDERRPRPRVDPGYRHPTTPWLLAAAAALAALGLGIWGWSEHRALDAARSPRLNVATLDLQPAGQDQVRGVSPEGGLDLASGATLYLSLPELAGDPELRVVIADDRGRERWVLRGGRHDATLGNLAVHLPPASLAPGSWEIRVYEAGDSAPLATYPLEVR